MNKTRHPKTFGWFLVVVAIALYVFAGARIAGAQTLSAVDMAVGTKMLVVAPSGTYLFDLSVDPPTLVKVQPPKIFVLDGGDVEPPPTGDLESRVAAAATRANDQKTVAAFRDVYSLVVQLMASGLPPSEVTDELLRAEALLLTGKPVEPWANFRAITAAELARPTVANITAIQKGLVKSAGAIPVQPLPFKLFAKKSKPAPSEHPIRTLPTSVVSMERFPVMTPKASSVVRIASNYRTQSRTPKFGRTRQRHTYRAKRGQ